MTADKEFAELLREAHRKSGITDKEFAAACGTSRENIYRWEQGWNSPSIKTADNLLKKLGMTMTIGKG